MKSSSAARRVFAPALVVCVAALLCAAAPSNAAPTVRAAVSSLASDSGLLKHLRELFMAETGIDVKWLPCSGAKAFDLGRAGAADLLLTRDPARERAFREAGLGIAPKKVMYSDRVLIGPEHDPASVRGMAPDAAAKKIAAHGMKLSRGTIKASGWGGYSIVERMAYVKYAAGRADMPPIVILSQSAALRDQYTLTLVSPAARENVRYPEARALALWLTGPKAQRAIAEFRYKGEPIFFPNAGGR